MVHLVLENYGTHKSVLIRRWLLKRARLHVHFTPDQRVLAQPGGELVRGYTERKKSFSTSARGHRVNYCESE